MAVAGNWLAQAVTPSEYAGATRWGTGVNPVHGQRDPSHKPTWSRIPLKDDSFEADDVLPEAIIGASQWGYSTEESALFPGEDYRYLDLDHPNWGDTAGGRPDRDGDILEMGLLPQPEGFPSWGPHYDDNPVDGFPVGGPPGGELIRQYSDGLDAERRIAIARPGAGVSGGWLNKAHGKVFEAETSSPAQYEINTSMTQLHRELDNGRAQARATDDPRTAIATRLTGIKEKAYAKSQGMGGGPATPDMKPVSQDTIPRRPWYYRGAALPAEEAHQYNEMSQFTPVMRTLPADAGETVTAQESAPDDTSYGYSPEDSGYGY